MISLQHGCIRKSDTDSSNNGTFLLLSVTWLQQELCKFPAIKFWQVAGNQSNILYISHRHPITLRKKKKKHFQYPDIGQFGAQATLQAMFGNVQVCALLTSVHKGHHVGHNEDTHQHESLTIILSGTCRSQKAFSFDDF